MKVSIVILNHNKKKLLKNCLDSIYNNTAGNYEVIVVDNGSSDGSKKILKEMKKVIGIYNSTNLGFAKGCNQGAKKALGNILIFLNNDTIVTKGWLEPIIKELSENKIGIVGSKLLFPDGRIQHAGIVFNNKLPKHIYHGFDSNGLFVNRKRKFQAVTGACLAIKRKLFFSVGLFDEHYINGLEDIDLCLKVRKAKRDVIYEPKSVVIHFESMTDNRLDPVRLKKNREYFKKKWGRFIKNDEEDYYREDGLFSYIKEVEKTQKAYKENVKYLTAKLDKIPFIDQVRFIRKIGRKIKGKTFNEKS